jgi:hypothetical protein
MSKSFSALAAITGMLFVAGCFGGTDEATERQNFALMMGEISCGTMENLDGSFGDDEAQAVAVKYGFGSWTEDDLNAYVSGLDETSKTEIRTTSVEYIDSNCASTFTDLGMEPTDVIDLLLTPTTGS